MSGPSAPPRPTFTSETFKSSVFGKFKNLEEFKAADLKQYGIDYNKRDDGYTFGGKFLAEGDELVGQNTGTGGVYDVGAYTGGKGRVGGKELESHFAALRREEDRVERDNALNTQRADNERDVQLERSRGLTGRRVSQAKRGGSSGYGSTILTGSLGVPFGGKTLLGS